jgi:integrase
MLTDTACKNAKPKDKKGDGGGLYLLMQPNGSKLWRLAYRFGGKQKTLAIGPYPVITLTAARDKRDDAKRLLADGIDPSVDKQEKRREQAAARTFTQWADEWLESEGRPTNSYDKKTMAGKKRYVGYLKDEFGKSLMLAIKRPDVLLYLRRLEQAGKLETRDRIRAAGEAIFHYADLDGSGHNPFANLVKQLTKNRSKPRPALTKPADAAKLFRAIAAEYPGARFDDLVGYALRFIALTVVRPGEIASVEWPDFDLDNALWTVPAEKMKMEREHVVPLSRQAVAILRQVHKLTGHRRHVFSCSRDKPISDNTLNKRLRNLGYDTKSEHCAHGFRTTFSTLLNGECDREGNKTWDGDMIELQLAHLDTTSVKAIYDRTGPMSLFDARARMMQNWADRVDTMIDGGNVVPIRKREEVA